MKRRSVFASSIFHFVPIRDHYLTYGRFYHTL